MLCLYFAVFTFCSCTGAGVDVPAVPPDYSALFINLEHFRKQVLPPGLVQHNGKPQAYWQTAEYEWQGGRFERIHITIARDPEFKRLYSSEAVKATRPAPTELKVGKKTAWYWDFQPHGVSDLEKKAHMLVIVLADDKVVIIDRHGAGLELVPDVAGKLDLDRIEKALDRPPRKP